MAETVDIHAFMRLRDEGTPVVDARSPGEFAHGHIPGAVNIPVLDDDERAQVGTAYAKGGQEAAVHLGLRLVGPSLANKLARARGLLTHQFPAGKDRQRFHILLHCWRGGMRSNALAWLLELGGFSVTVLEGGYKSYRALVREELARTTATVLVLGGMTGSGKTTLLHELARAGEQVIDLEGIAHHRGSAFGGVGLGAQPTNETVENTIHEAWRRLDPNRPVWLEDEDRRIGDVALCSEFFEHIRTGLLVLVDVPFAARVEHLAREYGRPEWTEDLAACVRRLERRLGGELTQRCVDDILQGRFADAAAKVLGSYDKLYIRQLEKHGRAPVARLAFGDGDYAAAATRLLPVGQRFCRTSFSGTPKGCPAS